MKAVLFTLLLLPVHVTSLLAQHSIKHAEVSHEIHPKHWRVAGLIGHTLIPSAQEHVFIPSWGLDLEYWPRQTLGIGLHSDVEIEQFIIIEGPEEEAIERVTPIVCTLDLLWKPWKGLVFVLGPGIEFEEDQQFTLLRTGIEYEVEIGHHFDIAPAIMYDDRLDGYHTWSIMLGVGKRF